VLGRGRLPVAEGLMLSCAGRSGIGMENEGRCAVAEGVSKAGVLGWGGELLVLAEAVLFRAGTSAAGMLGRGGELLAAAEGLMLLRAGASEVNLAADGLLADDDRQPFAAPGERVFRGTCDPGGLRVFRGVVESCSATAVVNVSGSADCDALLCFQLDPRPRPRAADLLGCTLSLAGLCKTSPVSALVCLCRT